MITTVNDLAKCLNEKGWCDVLVIDFRKAFDKVAHLYLLKKLHHHGIHGTLLLWLKCFLTDRLQYVTLNNQRSHITLVASGVPQGTVLAPLLFYCISMIFPVEYVPKWNYADDVLLHSHIKSEADCQSLWEDLEALVQWAHVWQMDFNFQKCELLRITNKKNPLVFNYCIASKPIRQVSHTKCLGVTIANDLSWNKHVPKVTNKARQANNFYIITYASVQII